MLVWIGCSVLSAGCSDGTTARGAVSGRVTYRDKPVPNAAVTFSPADGSRTATGRTDDDGNFTLGTFTANDGAAVGKHRVSIIANGPDRPPRPGESGSGMPGEMMPGDPLIPKKYFTPETSGLTHEVVKGQNTVDLKLTD